MKYSVFTSFTASGDVHRHKVVHTGEKPHLCDICGRGKQLFKIKSFLLNSPSIHLQYMKFLLTVIQVSNINIPDFGLTHQENWDAHFYLTALFYCARLMAQDSTTWVISRSTRGLMPQTRHSHVTNVENPSTHRESFWSTRLATLGRNHTAVQPAVRHFLPYWK